MLLNVMLLSYFDIVVYITLSLDTVEKLGFESKNEYDMARDVHSKGGPVFKKEVSPSF